MKNRAETNIGIWHDVNFVCQLARKYTDWKISKFGINEELIEEIDLINNVQEFLRSEDWQIKY